MANDTQLTVAGFLTGDPDLRFITSGAAVCSFTVASTPRKFDKSRNEWVDGETLFMRCSLWGTEAENVAASLVKGNRVIVMGRLVSRSWDKDGEKRTATEMQVDEVGLSLKFSRVNPENVIKSTAKSSGGGGFDNPESSPKGGADNDPWASAPAGDPPF